MAEEQEGVDFAVTVTSLNHGRHQDGANADLESSSAKTQRLTGRLSMQTIRKVCDHAEHNSRAFGNATNDPKRVFDQEI